MRAEATICAETGADFRRFAPFAFRPQIPRPWRTTTGNQIPDSENVIVTASYGHMLPLEVLNKVQQLNALNVHPSILPRWRGAAPIQYSIMAGDADGVNTGEGEQLGVTVQELSRGAFDKGRILAQKAVVRSCTSLSARELSF